MLYELILEGEPYWPEDESITRQELQAVHADLLHVRDFLRCVGRQVEESELSAEDTRLALFAAEIAGAVGRVADALEEGLA